MLLEVRLVLVLVLVVIELLVLETTPILSLVNTLFDPLSYLVGPAVMPYLASPVARGCDFGLFDPV